MDTVQKRIQQSPVPWGLGTGQGQGRSLVISPRRTPGARPGLTCPSGHTMKAQGEWRSDRRAWKVRVKRAGGGSTLDMRGAIERPGRQGWPWASGSLAWPVQPENPSWESWWPGLQGCGRPCRVAHASHPSRPADQRFSWG